MHLAIVTPFPPAITGIGQYGFHVTSALARSGAFGKISVLAGAREHQNSRHGIMDIDYCWEPGQLRTQQLILSRVKSIKPDLVWFNLGASVFGKSPLPNLMGMSTPMLTRRMGFATVVTLHELVTLTDLHALNAPGGIFAPLGAQLLTRIATRADVVCLTMQKYVAWLSQRGVDSQHIPIGAYHEPELLEEGSTGELLFFTTLAPYKGLELLLESFDRLKSEFPQLRLTIAGAEHMRFPGYAGDLKKKFNGNRNISWRGHVEESQVKELFRNARVVVLPYTASTGSSSVLYQAATWGRAVVASDLPENRALAHENDLKIQFFENGNIQSLQQAIHTLLGSTQVRKNQTTHNFSSIQKLRPSITCDRYIDAFNRALIKRGHVPQSLLKSREMQFP